MTFLRRVLILPKAYRYLGPKAIALYARYQLRLRSGILRVQSPAFRLSEGNEEFGLSAVVTPASRDEIELCIRENRSFLVSLAAEILSKQVRLFGGERAQLELIPPQPLKHWTVYYDGLPDGGDIKPTWEIGRFGWAVTLARAYRITGDEIYAEGFWKLTSEFLRGNPPNLGPQWSSAQEIALRVIALAFSYSLVADSATSTSKRKAMLAKNIAAHGARIPLTLDYSRAQNNNHFLSEAVGLWTAGCLIPEHPKAEQWRKSGRRLFTEGIDDQVQLDGRYVQHSSNYHRLMLQLGLWAFCLTRIDGQGLGVAIMGKLGKATNWLMNLMDDGNGQVANLGPNDGAYILPLTEQPFHDHRPVLQAASSVFLKTIPLEPGPWNDMMLWLGIQAGKPVERERSPDNPIRLEGENSWAYFRRTYFLERPGHADQLHLDLWYRGINIAQDAGSYLYKGKQPWDNALSSTRVHNTVTLDGLDQMTRVGRFLWLDWAQARMIGAHTNRGKLVASTAEHNGYKKLGIIHRREVRTEAELWVVSDHLIPHHEKRRRVRARLHWLLPDVPYEFYNDEVTLMAVFGKIKLRIETSANEGPAFTIMRAGEVVHGTAPSDPVLGWVSPTYGVKEPALSLNVDISGKTPFTITSTWILP
jgi:hypothetical protein